MTGQKDGRGIGGSQRGRGAITGRFVKQSTVRRHPDTTVNQKTPRRRRRSK